MTDTEINKACHSIVTGGEGCWHELVGGIHFRANKWQFHVCSCGRTAYNTVLEHHINKYNPDYLNNKSDAYDLIQYVVNEWGLWLDFYWKSGTIAELFKDQRALPEALAIYLKEGEGG